MESIVAPDDQPPPGPPIAGPAASHSAVIPRLLRDSSLYFVGNVVGRVLSFLMIPFYAGHLSTEEYGVLNLVELSISIIAIVFGLQSVGQTMTRIYHDQTTDEARRQVVSTALIASAVFAVVVATLAAVAAEPIAHAINLPGQANLLRAGFAAMVFGTLVEIILVYQRMRERARFFLAYSLVTLLLTLALNIWFIGVEHFGVWGFVSSKLVVTGLGSLFLLAHALREVGLRWCAAHARALAHFGAPLVLSSASYFAIHFSDRLFLAHVGRAQVGIYSLAYNFAFLLSILVGDSFGKSWNVSFYSYAENSGWQQRFVRIGFWLVFVLGTGAVGISLFGRDGLRLMVPADYLPPVLMLPVLVFGYFFRELGDFFRNILLIGIGSGLVGRIALAGAIFNVALNLLLIPRFGIWGATLSTAITWIAYCAVCWIAANRAHQVAFTMAPLVRLLLLAGAALALQAAWRPANRFACLAMDFGWLAFFMTTAVLFYLDEADRAEAWALLSRTAAKFMRRQALGGQRPPRPLL